MMDVPRSLKFIIAAIAVFAVGFIIFLFLLTCGVMVPLIVAPIWFLVIFMLLMTGLIVQGLEK